MPTLAAQSRPETGKKVRSARRAGFLPAVVYGPKIAAQAIKVRLHDFQKIYADSGESGIIVLRIGDGGQKQQDINVLIYGVARHPLTNIPIHADFYAVEMDKPVRTEIEIEFIGESPAVKNFGGILVHALQHIGVEALPQNLPRSLAVDCAILVELGSKIFVRDMLVPPDVRIITDPDIIVARVEMPRMEEEGQAAAPEIAEVKTEREIKQQEKVKEKEGETAETENR